MAMRVIEAEGLGKRYRLGTDVSSHRLTHGLLPARSGDKANEFWALRDVSLKVEDGESIGIIGRNGAGKSTLLKLLSRITAPTEGRMRIRGRVGTLLEVGTGFHPERTGRDNVFLSGTILGLRYREVKAKFDEIVAFSGVEKFIDTPVKRYSTGMQVRLAFSVTLYLDPEILIVDEVLAVADLEFQRKSLKKLRDATKKEGRTLLFVSHGLEAIQRFCKRVLVLENGRVTFDGPADEGIGHYRNSVPLQRESLRDTNLQDRLRRATGKVRFTKVDALNSHGEVKWSFQEGETATFRVAYEVVEPISNLLLIFRFLVPRDLTNERNEKIITDIHEIVSRTPLPAGYQGTMELVLPNLALRASPLLYIWCGDVDHPRNNHDVIDANVDLPTLFIRGNSSDSYKRQGIISLDYRIRTVAA
jgi:lipopolysaccharide transport system ATP-binding protein